MPPLLATIVTPESTATFLSIPVPTRGLSANRVGTACRCMLEPIRALFASSCSKNGIKEAAIETICFGETSIYSIDSGGIKVNSFWYLAEINSSISLFFPSRVVLAWAITKFPSSIAERYLILLVALPLTTSL